MARKCKEEKGQVNPPWVAVVLGSNKGDRRRETEYYWMKFRPKRERDKRRWGLIAAQLRA